MPGNWKKLWNMKVTIVPFVIGVFGTVTKWLLKELEDLEVGWREETIQTTALLGTARILRRVLETWGDLLSLKLQWKPSAKTDVKNSQGVNDNYNFNCKSKEDFLVAGKCNLKNVVYQATIFPKVNVKDKNFYIRISSVRWKLGKNNHIHFFSHEHLRN